MPSSRKSPRERWQSLAGTDAVAKQDVDQRTFTWNANIAQVKAAQANVDRLIAEEGFKRLIAPFDGIVTARETDIGALINVGAARRRRSCSWSPRRASCASTSTCRRTMCRACPPAPRPRSRVPEHPGKTYSGTVEASAQAVNPEHRHDADAAHRRQQRRRDDAGRLRQHPSADRRRRPGAQRALERTDLRRQGTFHRDRGRRTTAC